MTQQFLGINPRETSVYVPKDICSNNHGSFIANSKIKVSVNKEDESMVVYSYNGIRYNN